MRCGSLGPPLLLLLCGLRAETQGEEVRAMVGSDVRLSCVYPEGNSFDLNDLYVYWQIDVPGKRDANSVVTYYLSGNSSAGHGDNHYKGRARLFLDAMTQGDFSLHLHNVTPQDEQKFNCLVFRKSLELNKILEVTVTLHVAANYSMPVVSGPSQDGELTFTCTSMNGYPRPNVYWINKTDNSLLDAALQNSTVSLNERGLYDVVSVLRIGWAPSINVDCCIENVLLHQNLTSGQTEMFAGTKDSITEDPADGAHDAGSRPVLSVLAVLVVAVAVAVATGWLCRNRCPHRSYAGAQAARPEPELAGVPSFRGSESPGEGLSSWPLSACSPVVLRTPRCGMFQTYAEAESLEPRPPTARTHHSPAARLRLPFSLRHSPALSLGGRGSPARPDPLCGRAPHSPRAKVRGLRAPFGKAATRGASGSGFPLAGASGRQGPCGQAAGPRG
ncbi:ICOS ligand isoform X1 [Hippopotamus amphibius kiboko]|uniref:ICOS ligand isoform X1 n=1 Tax=Hippopotamus amphibius kiboko TaxID=575201 RepID=UPI002592DB3A|nr:ICOS ligand isoform X1 [Hippopotamus amphibius kiboko]